jgi:hypothetical protein
LELRAGKTSTSKRIEVQNMTTKNIANVAIFAFLAAYIAHASREERRSMSQKITSTALIHSNEAQ